METAVTGFKSVSGLLIRDRGLIAHVRETVDNPTAKRNRRE
jgi:hypothetical protein